jgi:predicted PurR-regulated permease PerM
MTGTSGRMPVRAANQRDTNPSAHASDWALPVIAVGVIVAVLYWARIVFITATLSVIIALILEPFVSLLGKMRLPRSLATAVVCVVAVLSLYFAGLTAWNQVSTIVSDVPALRQNLTSLIESISGRIQRMEDSVAGLLNAAHKTSAASVSATPPATASTAKKNRRAIPAPAPPTLPPGFIPEVRIHEDNPISALIYAQLGALYQYAVMASFVPLLVFFMLSWRDHIYQSFLRFFEGPARLTAARSVQGIAGMARAFVVGNFLIGVMLTALSAVFFAIIHLPYPFLIGGLSGFLSLVPYAGIVLALLPPLLAALATGAPSSVLVFSLLFAIALHLVAMNILYPTLVGARVHLNPLIVTFSLMFWVFLWDAPGLILAIPITAGLKAVCDNVPALRKYGRFLGD